MKRKKWTCTYGDMEEGKQLDSADIKTPHGKSIFGLDCDEFFGLSNHMAEKIVALLNKAESL